MLITILTDSGVHTVLEEEGGPVIPVLGSLLTPNLANENME